MKNIPGVNTISFSSVVLCIITKGNCPENILVNSGPGQFITNHDPEQLSGFITNHDPEQLSDFSANHDPEQLSGFITNHDPE